mgnify:CR=1 FL=1
MTIRLDPKTFGITARTQIERLDEGTVALVINRKSRIIMSDGEKISEKIQKIKRNQPQTHCVFKTNAPVCSKTIAFLEREGIDLILA